MRSFFALVSRNCKLFFRDKGVFLPSLIAPLILLFLFIAFLGDVYRDSIRGVLGGFPVTDAAVESIASGWLISSLLAVCTVTIAFTANTVMVQDRVRGCRDDFLVSPVPPVAVKLSYFFSTFLTTALVCYVAMGAGFLYMAAAGWHLTAGDILLSVLDTALLVLFGTAFSSVVCDFLHSSGGVTAVEATVSAAYGFLCGAYMPLGQYAPWLSNILGLLPGTHGTVLLHLHLMGGAMEAVGNPALAQGLKEGFDCTLSLFGHAIPVWASYLILVGGILLFTAVFAALGTRSMQTIRRRRHVSK